MLGRSPSRFFGLGFKMAIVQHNSQLNQLLIDLGCSLLQYVGQCSFWTSRSDAPVVEQFRKLVELQQENEAELADLLTERRWTIDYGGFPSDFASLNFLSLKYLLKLVVQNQKQVLVELEDALHVMVDDPEASELIGTIVRSERHITERLETLMKPAIAT